MPLAGDEPLTLADVLGLRLDEGPNGGVRLAVLSACETMLPGTDLCDEVISLPTWLLQAGVAGIVASQFAVPDLAAVLVMTRFTACWRTDGASPAEAFALGSAVGTRYDQRREGRVSPPRPRQRVGRPLDAARALWRALAVRPPDARDFAALANWALFAHVGV